MKNNCNLLTKIITFCALFACYNCTASATVLSDFDTGDLQGWTKGTPFFNPLFAGNLETTPTENGGYALVATDTMIKGGGLYALAPRAYTGDLSLFSSINWDEFIPSSSVLRTSITLVGENDSVYTGVTVDQQILTPDVWVNRLIPFDFSSGLWSLQSGSDSFEDVLSNVKGLYVQMDVTQANFFNLSEAKIDNITLTTDFDIDPISNDLTTVPIPAAVIFYCSGLIGLIGCSNRCRKTPSE